jgi:hypothetical protein
MRLLDSGSRERGGKPNNSCECGFDGLLHSAPGGGLHISQVRSFRHLPYRCRLSRFRLRPLYYLMGNVASDEGFVEKVDLIRRAVRSAEACEGIEVIQCPLAKS